MKFRQFLSVVPKAVRTASSIIVVCAVLIGLIAGFLSAREGGGMSLHSYPLPMRGSLAGLGFGLLVGVVMGAWLLCLGYVYADARRRAMPAVLWVLVAVFVPNLLGFLLYFAVRRPIALPCTQCGQPITADHQFCSWCGHQGSRGPQGTQGSQAATSPGM